MLEYLATLRTKPRQTRKRIAFFSASVLSVLIFTTWFYSRVSPVDERSIALSEATEPIAVVANTFLGFTETTKDLTATFNEEMVAAEKEMSGVDRVLLTGEEPEDSSLGGTPETPPPTPGDSSAPPSDPFLTLPADTPTDESTTTSSDSTL